MENLGKRATLTITVTFLLAMLGWGLALPKVADSYPRVHCDYHSATVTCTPET